MRSPSKVLATIVAFSIVASCHSPAVPRDPSVSTRERIEDFWSAQHRWIVKQPSRVISEPSHGFDPRAYPAEVAVSFLSAYQLTGENRYLQDAKRQLSYARGRETDDHVIKWPRDLASWLKRPATASNGQVRLVLAYYIAYSVTGSARYLRWADQAMAALLRMPVKNHEFNGKTYRLFYFLYTRKRPHRPLSGTEIDPNQKAFIAVAAGLLTSDVNSKFYQRESLEDVGVEQLDAALALQTSDGRLPLSETEPYIHQFDTRYGHLALMLALWASQELEAGSHRESVRLGVDWVNEFTRSVETDRYYPTEYRGELKDPTELYYRLPLIHGFAEGDAQALRDAEDQVWKEWRSFRTIPGGWVTPFAVFDLMGLPRKTYWAR